MIRSIMSCASQDLGLREIAQALHLNENTVKSRLYRTLKKLKETFQWQEDEALHETKRFIPAGDESAST